MIRIIPLILLLLFDANAFGASPVVDECAAPTKVQVLGSGGESPDGERALSSYLIWIDGKARILVDVGTGAVLRLGDSGAHPDDLDAVLLSQLVSDYTNDLPALITSALRGDRSRALTLYGPVSNAASPQAQSTVTFVRTLMDGARGVYRHLGDVLSPLGNDRFKLNVKDVRRRPPPIGVRVQRSPPETTLPVHTTATYRVSAAYVSPGSFPALAWRIEIGERRIVLTGPTKGDVGLDRLAQNADLLIAHHSVTEDAPAAERNLSMSPSVIARLAQNANAKRLVLSHRTPRTLGLESGTLAAIRSHYPGTVVFAEDLACYAL